MDPIRRDRRNRVTVTEELVALGIGCDVLPEVPVYHWLVIGSVPAVMTESVVEVPGRIVTKDGWVTIETWVQGVSAMTTPVDVATAKATAVNNLTTMGIEFYLSGIAI
jgi:hypothetical protein